MPALVRRGQSDRRLHVQFSRHDGPVPETFDAGKVDLVCVTADGLTVNLYIVQSDPCIGSDDQLQSLQRKLHNYVSFALDGEPLTSSMIYSSMS